MELHVTPFDNTPPYAMCHAGQGTDSVLIQPPGSLEHVGQLARVSKFLLFFLLPVFMQTSTYIHGPS